MKKNIKRDSKGRFSRNKSEFSFVNLATYTSPEIIEVKNRDWVQYGADNNYFQFILDRFNGSPTNNACINGISQSIYGKGLNATDANRKPGKYAEMISLLSKDMIRKVCYDFYLMGQCAIQVVYSKDKSRIALCEHFPIETLRSEKADENGDVTGYYYWNDWPNIKPSDKPLRIPAFGTSKENIEIVYIKPYKSGFYYYSPVSYQGGIQYAELEEEISNFHLNNILNGLAPSMLINFNNGTPNQEQRELIEQRIAQKFSGSSNAGKFILAFNDNKEQQAEITPVQLSDAHSQYQFLSTESQSKILVAHRVVSPMLLGIKDQTGLGNNADEIKTASLLMDNTVIRPFQELLIDNFDKILAYNDITLNLYFTTLQPLEFTEVDSKLQDKETIEEETGVKMNKTELKTIDGVEVYETKEQAIQKAKEMGCSSYHEHIEDDKVWFMPCESHSKISELSSSDVKVVLGSLNESAIKLNEKWVKVAEQEENAEYSDEDWANYLIKEKSETTLHKIKRIVGLVSATEDNVGSVNDGSEQSRLDSKNGLYRIRYTYRKGVNKSNSKSRAFCTQMMNLSSQGVVWRIEDIDNASYSANVNVQFRHKPSMRYDIFTLKGGVYCQHKWVKVLYRLASNTEVSENLGNYNKTKTIPASYIKNPVGYKDAAIATTRIPGKGKYPN